MVQRVRQLAGARCPPSYSAPPPKSTRRPYSACPVSFTGGSSGLPAAGGRRRRDWKRELGGQRAWNIGSTYLRFSPCGPDEVLSSNSCARYSLSRLREDIIASLGGRFLRSESIKRYISFALSSSGGRAFRSSRYSSTLRPATAINVSLYHSRSRDVDFLCTESTSPSSSSSLLKTSSTANLVNSVIRSSNSSGLFRVSRISLFKSALRTKLAINNGIHLSFTKVRYSSRREAAFWSASLRAEP